MKRKLYKSSKAIELRNLKVGKKKTLAYFGYFFFLSVLPFLNVSLIFWIKSKCPTFFILGVGVISALLICIVWELTKRLSSKKKFGTIYFYVASILIIVLTDEKTQSWFGIPFFILYYERIISSYEQITEN